MKENQWNMKGKPIQTEKRKRKQKNTHKNTKTNPNPFKLKSTTYHLSNKQCQLN